MTGHNYFVQLARVLTHSLWLTAALQPTSVFSQAVREAEPPAAFESSNPASVGQPASGRPQSQTPADGESVPKAEDGASNTADADLSGQLQLSDVIASVYRAYPLIEQARWERANTRGQIIEAYGAYDTKLQGYTLSEPTGFYRNYRNEIGVARQTWWGGYLSAGYRIGRGEFQPWYKERQTNKGGEFKLALGVPLLQGRAIDANRVAVFQASLANQIAEPLIQQTILDSSRDAAVVYWDWLAAGGTLAAQREMLQLALTRGEQYEVGVKAGRFPEIDLIFNQQLIAERRGKVLESEQKFRALSFKLSLFLRDQAGQPMIPDDTWLPTRFPVVQPLPPSDFQADLAAALERRPEPRVLQLQLRQVQIDQQLARNNLLPDVDVLAEATQDTGIAVSDINDKGQFELLVGLQGEVPLQRRKARGKIQSTAAKFAQLDQKLRFQRDKIGTELLTAYNALILSAQIIEQADVSLRAALETLVRYRFAFDQGSEKVDLIYINLLETKVNESEIKLVDAQRSWFTALVNMQAALGLDPLDQALLISALPPSTLAHPGDLQEPAIFEP